MWTSMHSCCIGNRNVNFEHDVQAAWWPGLGGAPPMLVATIVGYGNGGVCSSDGGDKVLLV